MAAHTEPSRLPDQLAPRSGQAPVGARSNAWIADRLRQAAGLLTAQGANPFRIAAYRRAADALAGLDEDVRAIFDRGGHAALDAVPGIGPELAERILATLHVDSLEALEEAAHDGRLAGVPGIGPRRAAMVRSALAELLSRLRPSPSSPTSEPEAAMLLDMDREYRDKAAEGVLHRIAPKRFNPTGEAWLPVLHTVRGPWHFTALFSNTALAHRLGRTADWVVIYFSRDSGPEGRRTVVTETGGATRGRRVVRGREAECLGPPAAKAERPSQDSGGSARIIP